MNTFLWKFFLLTGVEFLLLFLSASTPEQERVISRRSLFLLYCCGAGRGVPRSRSLFVRSGAVTG